jgi:starch phosphorylase
MRAYRSYTVVPSLPESLQELRTIAYNLWWCWSPDAIELLRRVDREKWEECGHNPVALLGATSQERWEQLADDESFRQHLERVLGAFNDYLQAPTWFGRNLPQAKDRKIAYFSFEYGLSEGLPIYAGGLGVLAGDHLKSASDMGVPLVGIGLLYQVGYFRQYLNADGWQQEAYTENDFHQLPVERVLSEDGGQLTIHIPTDDHMLTALVWRVNVGRNPLYLLDTNTPENSAEDRAITYQLYAADSVMRIRQEILLGIGGIQALESLGIEADVYHMNEGHAAFMALERVRRAMIADNLSFDEAVETTRVGNVFTTHTPVPAGHDRFPPDLVDRYFRHYYPQLGLSLDQFLALGRANPQDVHEEFCMTALALRLSAWRNGVSALHGEVSRNMWRGMWPQAPVEEVPISSVTNGVHIGSWISSDLAVLYDRYLGTEWRSEPGDQTIWRRVATIPESELWRAHERRRERLVAVARQRLRAQLAARGAGPADLAMADEVLDPEALTIGFGRRFATYKRANLILRDPERLRALLTSKDRPVQIVFAGKAHPNDRPGKELIREIVHFSSDPAIRNRIVFLENYDMNLARYMVQGVDVWLNTPRRPMEASGTSGMKATANGGINCSILDGWWVEGYTPDTGWAIGRGEEYQDAEQQDAIEADGLYTLLEQEIIPLFYDHGSDGLPHGWIRKMKSAMGAICPDFNSNRMLGEYVQRYYIPGMRRSAELAANGHARARDVAGWLGRVRSGWPQVRFVEVSDDGKDVAEFGDKIAVRARVALGSLAPGDVLAQLEYGAVDSAGNIGQPTVRRMEYVGPGQDGTHAFLGTVICEGTGRWGYAVRLLPSHRDLVNPVDANCVLWS